MKKKGVLYRIEYRVDGVKGLLTQDIFADGGETHDDVRKYFHATHQKGCVIKRIGTTRIKDSSKLFPFGKK
jgi:hypothetical protein